MSPLLDKLEALLGADGVLRGMDTARYDTDHRRLYRGRSLAVVRPRTTADVAATVRLCASAGVPMVPSGGNTSYCGGATPDDSGSAVVISLERLRAIRAVDPMGGTLVAEAGCTLQAVHDAAAEVDYRFPLSLGSEGTCQIGGNLSTNAGGTQVLRHGMMRDLTLGLEVVLPDGRVLNRLRRLRKDNTGYDVKQWFIGAEGTLGIITAAALKIIPASDGALTALIAVDGLDATLALLQRLRRGFGDLVETFEYMPAAAVGLVRHHFPHLKDPFVAEHPARVLLALPQPRALHGLRDALERVLAEEIGAGRVRDVALAQSERDAAAFWFLRENIPAAQAREGASLKHDVSLPLDRLAEFERRGLALIATLVPGGRSVGYGHAGDGNLHFNVSPAAGTVPGSDAERAFLACQEPLMHAVHDLVAELHGSFSAEHGIGRLKVAELEAYEDPVALVLMGQLKAALDPRGLMNPGKILRPA